ncbi:hypothetical protein CWE12_13005 [Aliidiomarina sedimenti]|uniref:Uncharacterized protein n=1 Tax=Aliidiomarina sedimenti TaxID=1933879 RepID=A0ABY0BVJ1_9GAMM|nr:hypothetical protein [Aliidiomarina sedimenti]RUO28132.1 hypothetical protein CWE12_13005 [Aliidiomarina sedimenti]
MPTTAKVLTALLVLGTLFVAIFLVVYFALLGLVFIPLVLGLAYLLFRGIKASASDAKSAANDKSSQ